MIIDTHISSFFCCTSRDSEWLRVSFCSDLSIVQDMLSLHFDHLLSAGVSVIVGVQDVFIDYEITPVSIKTDQNSDWQNYVLFRHGVLINEQS